MADYKEALQALTALENPHQRTFEVPRERLVETVRALRDSGDMMMIDLSATEYEDHLAGIVHMMSLSDYDIFQLKTPLDKEDLHLPTLSEVYPAAWEMEREAYDLFGIIYDDHPHLTRILCADDFVGHPLRKDYVMNTRD